MVQVAKASGSSAVQHGGWQRCFLVLPILRDSRSHHGWHVFNNTCGCLSTDFLLVYLRPPTSSSGWFVKCKCLSAGDGMLARMLRDTAQNRWEIDFTWSGFCPDENGSVWRQQGAQHCASSNTNRWHHTARIHTWTGLHTNMHTHPYIHTHFYKSTSKQVNLINKKNTHYYSGAILNPLCVIPLF